MLTTVLGDEHLGLHQRHDGEFRGVEIDTLDISVRRSIFLTVVQPTHQQGRKGGRGAVQDVVASPFPKVISH